jgi:hypothetical protein
MAASWFEMLGRTFCASISTLGPVRILRGFSFGLPSTSTIAAHQLPAAPLKPPLTAADYCPARNSGHQISPLDLGPSARVLRTRCAGASPYMLPRYNAQRRLSLDTGLQAPAPDLPLYHEPTPALSIHTPSRDDLHRAYTSGENESTATGLRARGGALTALRLPAPTRRRPRGTRLSGGLSLETRGSLPSGFHSRPNHSQPRARIAGAGGCRPDGL